VTPERMLGKSPGDKARTTGRTGRGRPPTRASPKTNGPPGGLLGGGLRGAAETCQGAPSEPCGASSLRPSSRGRRGGEDRRRLKKTLAPRAVGRKVPAGDGPDNLGRPGAAANTGNTRDNSRNGPGRAGWCTARTTGAPKLRQLGTGAGQGTKSRAGPGKRGAGMFFEHRGAGGGGPGTTDQGHLRTAAEDVPGGRGLGARRYLQGATAVKWPATPAVPLGFEVPLRSGPGGAREERQGGRGLDVGPVPPQHPKHSRLIEGLPAGASDVSSRGGGRWRITGARTDGKTGGWGAGGYPFATKGLGGAREAIRGVSSEVFCPTGGRRNGAGLAARRVKTCRGQPRPECWWVGALPLRTGTRRIRRSSNPAGKKSGPRVLVRLIEPSKKVANPHGRSPYGCLALLSGLSQPPGGRGGPGAGPLGPHFAPGPRKRKNPDFPPATGGAGNREVPKPWGFSGPSFDLAVSILAWRRLIVKTAKAGPRIKVRVRARESSYGSTGNVGEGREGNREERLGRGPTFGRERAEAGPNRQNTGRTTWDVPGGGR